MKDGLSRGDALCRSKLNVGVDQIVVRLRQSPLARDTSRFKTMASPLTSEVVSYTASK